MTLDEAKQNLAAKREQLIEYRDKIEGNTLVMDHARTMANGRIAQIEQDIRVLARIEI